MFTVRLVEMNAEQASWCLHRGFTSADFQSVGFSEITVTHCMKMDARNVDAQMCSVTVSGFPLF